eukprot:1850439-Rhodomonas_salina.4
MAERERGEKEKEEAEARAVRFKPKHTLSHLEAQGFMARMNKATRNSGRYRPVCISLRVLTLLSLRVLTSIRCSGRDEARGPHQRPRGAGARGAAEAGARQQHARARRRRRREGEAAQARRVVEDGESEAERDERREQRRERRVSAAIRPAAVLSGSEGPGWGSGS